MKDVAPLVTPLMFTQYQTKKMTTTMNDTKIVLTDKQIMAAQLDAEETLTEELSQEIETLKEQNKMLMKRNDELETKVYHLRCLLRAYL